MRGRKVLLFTPEEDKYLKMGLDRHGFGNWTAIRRDPDFHFQKGRKPNSLLNRRAITLTLDLSYFPLTLSEH